MTLIELTVVLLILTTLATVALRSTTNLVEQARWEQTKKLHEEIKKGIIGNPKLIINDQPDISGFVADMGRLPNNIHELLDKDYCFTDYAQKVSTSCTGTAPPFSATVWVQQTPPTPATPTQLGFGWNGPYLITSQNSADKFAFADGWRDPTGGATGPNDNSYGWNYDATGTPNLTLQSYGKDHITSAGSEYEADYPVSPNALAQEDWQVDISGGISVQLRSPYISNNCAAQSVLTEPACTGAGWTWNSGAPTCSDPMHTLQTDCVDNGEIWGECDGASNSKTFCESNGGTWFFKNSDIKLLVFYRNGAGAIASKTSNVATIEDNGLQKIISFGFSANTFIPMGINRIFIQKNTTTDIYPPSCAGLTNANCTTASGTPLNNGLCDDIQVSECETATGTSIRNTLKIPFIPHQSMLILDW